MFSSKSMEFELSKKQQPTYSGSASAFPFFLVEPLAEIMFEYPEGPAIIQLSTGFLGRCCVSSCFPVLFMQPFRLKFTKITPTPLVLQAD
jgi:hypothetical protein